ncbi:MAG: potassium channel family protein [Mycobacterium sp.]|uniref:potassium channel family protein n=1 Tax=Mycobacterium sp. TaxID=1785 RepID=UPI003F95553C
MTIALFYLGVLIIYAIVYDGYLGDFYQTTSAYEPGFNQTQLAVVSGLTKALNLAARDTPPGKAVGAEHYELQPDSLRVSELSVGACGTLTFQVRYTCTTTHSMSVAGLEVTLEAHPRGIEYRPTGRMVFFPLTQTANDPLCGFDIGTLAGDDHQQSTSARVVVDPVIADDIDSLLRAKTGSADLPPGRHVRAFYLSAVTITTLGFGDVVPVTTRARALIASEALFGVVLAGLFVNAVWGPRHRAESS